jgi:chitinase
MLLRIAIILSFSTLIQAAAFTQNTDDTIACLAATGYKNVAYFVNWVRFT